MKTPFFATLAASLAVLAAPSDAQCVLTTDGTGIQCQTLFAGQTIDAGEVCVEIVGTNLVVEYNTANGWELVETHVWVGDSLADMPQTRKGNPKVGNFPYKSGDVTGTTSWSLTVPLANLNFTCPAPDKIFYVAAHAALQKPDDSGGFQTETGWSDGDRFVEKGNWGTFTTITLTCDCGDTPPPPVGVSCETAFGRGSVNTCFLDIDEDGNSDGDFSRWGWSNGPLGPGLYTLDVYAGAGQCDVTKGTLVGTLTVDYVDGMNALVTFSTTGCFSMTETHLYVGNEILARDVNNEFTVAPGQYPLQHDLNNATEDGYEINGLSGDIYVVGHAVVCAPDDCWL